MATAVPIVDKLALMLFHFLTFNIATCQRVSVMSTLLHLMCWNRVLLLVLMIRLVVALTKDSVDAYVLVAILYSFIFPNLVPALLP